MFYKINLDSSPDCVGLRMTDKIENKLLNEHF
jgi:hypothetical protein